jgi:hypothetical protein
MRGVRTIIAIDPGKPIRDLVIALQEAKHLQVYRRPTYAPVAQNC